MRFGFLWKNILVERLVEKQDHSPEEKGASCRAWHESSGWENLGFPIICSEHIGQQFGFHNFARRQGPDQLPLASDVDVVACVKAQQEIIKSIRTYWKPIKSPMKNIVWVHGMSDMNLGQIPRQANPLSPKTITSPRDKQLHARQSKS